MVCGYVCFYVVYVCFFGKYFEKVWMWIVGFVVVYVDEVVCVFCEVY